MRDDRHAWPVMCEWCTCCRYGKCTINGRWCGYCPALCPCEPENDLDDYDDGPGDESEEIDP